VINIKEYIKDQKSKENLIATCLYGNYNNKITGLEILHHLKSHFMTYCNYHVNEEEKDPEIQYIIHLKNKGIDHEKLVIEKLYPRTKHLEFIDQVSGFKEAIQDMYNGVESISNVPLLYLPNDFVGRADLLVKSYDRSSIFGDYYYKIYEIKIAKNIRKHHIMQGVYYNKILGEIQNYISDTVFMINNEFKEYDFKYSEYCVELDSVIKEIKQIRNGDIKPYPSFNGVEYPWSNYSNKLALEKGDVTCIPGIGKDLQMKLINIGIDSIIKLKDSEIEKLIKVNGIAEKTATKFINHAEALITGKRLKIGVHSLKIII
jgi:predicted RecB family nuclease